MNFKTTNKMRLRQWRDRLFPPAMRVTIVRTSGTTHQTVSADLVTAQLLKEIKMLRAAVLIGCSAQGVLRGIVRAEATTSAMREMVQQQLLIMGDIEAALRGE